MIVITQTLQASGLVTSKYNTLKGTQGQDLDDWLKTLKKRRLCLTQQPLQISADSCFPCQHKTKNERNKI